MGRGLQGEEELLKGVGENCKDADAAMEVAIPSAPDT